MLELLKEWNSVLVMVLRLECNLGWESGSLMESRSVYSLEWDSE